MAPHRPWHRMYSLDAGLAVLVYLEDVSALMRMGQDKGYESHLLEEILKINEKIKHFATQSIMKAASPEDTIGILGLAFKPQTDDVRNSPARDIIRNLLDKGYKHIVAYDPLAADHFRKSYALPIQYASTLEDCVEKSNVLSILTGWREFIHGRGDV